ncbi:MAG: PAS domain-containing sensor histidine kinase [Cytophagales bacterium]
MGGLISDNTPKLQQVLSTWIFSTSGLLLIIFDIKERWKIFAGCLLILGSHLLIVPTDIYLSSGYDPSELNDDLFVSISFIFSMILLMGSIFYSQSTDLKIYKDLAQGLQEYNDKLLSQDEELRQSYEEIRTNREQIYVALETVNEKKGHLELALKIAKMGSYHYYFQDDESFWSDELKTLMELDTAEWENEKFSIYDFILEEEHERVKNEVAKAIDGTNEYSIIYKIATRKGTVKTVHSAGFVFQDSQGVRVGIRGILHDITDYKNIETELTETNKELENFIYRAYHDIKGPVATIKGLCYVAALTTNESVSLHYFGLLKLHMYQLETILSKLLVINEMKQMKLMIKPLNGHKLLDEVANSLKNIEGFEKVNFVRDVELPDTILSDKLMLKIILQNLIENSFAFKSNNSSWIKVHLQLEANSLIISITDNGIGISDEYFDKIFERYFRVSERSKGTGLGLYIVKKLVDKLSGVVEVRSIPYLETSFVVTIPIS